jgi:hypothetical protein
MTRVITVAEEDVVAHDEEYQKPSWPKSVIEGPLLPGSLLKVELNSNQNRAKSKDHSEVRDLGNVYNPLIAISR